MSGHCTIFRPVRKRKNLSADFLFAFIRLGEYFKRMGISKHSGSTEPRLHQVGVGAVRENGKVIEGLI